MPEDNKLTYAALAADFKQKIEAAIGTELNAKFQIEAEYNQHDNLITQLENANAASEVRSIKDNFLGDKGYLKVISLLPKYSDLREDSNHTVALGESGQDLQNARNGFGYTLTDSIQRAQRLIDIKLEALVEKNEGEQRGALPKEARAEITLKQPPESSDRFNADHVSLSGG